MGTRITTDATAEGRPGTGRRRRPSVAALVLLLGACGTGDAGVPPPTTAERRAVVAADSAAGDRDALAALPGPLQGVLRLEPYLTDRFIAATPGAECLVLGDSLPDVLVAERRRVRLRLPDSSAVVVFARVDREGATLRRVEVVRRPLGGDQLGFIWDGDDDVTTEVRWPAGPRGRTETARQPRGSPVPRAVRALGRRVLDLRCPAGAALDSAARDEADATRRPPP